MNKFNLKSLSLSSYLCLSSVIAGFLVLFGWFYNIDILKSVIPNFPTMKPISAFLFILSGILLFHIENIKIFKEKIRHMSISSSVFAIFGCLLMISYNILTPVMAGNSEIIDSYKTFYPSIGTLVAFFLIALRGLFYIFDTNKIKFVRLLGHVVTFIGAVSMLGYLFNLHKLYTYGKAYSNGMAIHTSILFVIIGIILLRTGVSSKKHGIISLNNL